jgi:MFS family permease
MTMYSIDPNSHPLKTALTPPEGFAANTKGNCNPACSSSDGALTGSTQAVGIPDESLTCSGQGLPSLHNSDLTPTSTSNALCSQPDVVNLPPPPEEPERGFMPVLRNRQFLALWGGQVFSQLADKVYLVLMIALITSQLQTDDQPISGWVSAVMIAFTIPAVLFGSVAGALVDRWPKKVILVATNLLRGSLVLALPGLLWFFKDWQPVMGMSIRFAILLAVTFGVSTLTQFFAPAEQAVMPLIVEKRHLLSANSLYTTTIMASLIVGFAVGEPLLALADTILDGVGTGVGKELVVGGSYAIAGLLLLLMKTGEKEISQAVSDSHVWQDIRDGLRYLKYQREVRTALFQQIILFSIFAALSVLAVRLAQVIPDIKASQFGFLLAVGGVGLALGAAVVGNFGHYVKSHTRLSLYGSVGLALALAGLSVFEQQLWPALFCIAWTGFFAALVAVPVQTVIQEQTPEDMRGKVFGLQNNAVNIALSLPLALAGVAETFLGLRTVLLSLALMAIAGGGLTWYISVTGKIKS